MQTTVTSKGQITVPKKVRDHLHLAAGDQVAFFVEPDGSVRLVPVTRSITMLKGCVPRPDRTLSVDEMDIAIAQGAARA
ncbi:MAG: AbrB/MazE/SpoVT family DNA-binding domain-containing protein [Proteobacteria bacterium]|nr:AbrB/MazE/SpoVT family DNA-binding domain-containing protein [Burkholderiales bacterium]MCA0312117.1 AbrB/MazE/SpoVT family DNA-binding domain-containing protein [Pseudomonadota bacterium]